MCVRHQGQHSGVRVGVKVGVEKGAGVPGEGNKSEARTHQPATVTRLRTPAKEAPSAAKVRSLLSPQRPGSWREPQSRGWERGWGLVPHPRAPGSC